MLRIRALLSHRRHPYSPPYCTAVSSACLFFYTYVVEPDMTGLSQSTPPQAPSVAVGPRTLVAGASGFIGRFVAEASLSAGHATYVLVHSSSASATYPSKANAYKSLQDQGAILITVMLAVLYYIFSTFQFVLGLFSAVCTYNS